MSRFAIIGLGTFGAAVATKLMEKGHEVLAIDSDPDRVDAMRDLATQVVCLDARDPRALRMQGAGDVDVAVVALGEAFEPAVLASVNLKQELEVPRVVARARRKSEQRVLRAVGVDEVVWPEEEAGSRLGEVLTNPEIHDWKRLGPDFSIAELDTPKALAGKTVLESGLRTAFALNLVAVRRPGPDGNPSERLVVPGPDTVLSVEDQLVLGGRNEDLARFIEVD
jgi:trk system potassium uptake protein TrkA